MALAHAGDFLMANPTTTALRKFSFTCGDQASKFNILFGAKKFNCIISVPKSTLKKIKIIVSSSLMVI